ncbi:SUMF1/EgtB/PvdO family nonheme iron enzyme [Moorena producens]|uniref:SUMF1/EgtB/PvdO family nonheme iron enzyme n=1 Tax=Moorena producens TaxID=1155739 RepID=UPI001930FFC3|nr:SUMF1/EgtB/PvdO family nonheme iron enzyme [Moorena producens]
MNAGHTPGYLLAQIESALCSAFPSEIKLAMMLQHQFNINLSQIASGGNLTEIVYKVVQDFNSSNSLAKLINKALKENQNNFELNAIEEKFEITISLVKILLPLEKNLTKQMQQAYRDCCPDWKNNIPDSFYDLLENLDDIHQPTDDEKLIVKFVDSLLVNGNIPKSKAEQLKQWLAKNAKNVYNLESYKQNFNRKSDSDQSSKSEISRPEAEEESLKQFSFEVVTVNRRGETIKEESQQADYFTQDLGNGVDLEMVSIPAGSFLMGSPKSERYSNDSERPQHQVTIQPFFLGKYQVTQAQWRAVANLPKIKRDLKPDPSYFPGDNRPVEQVNWYDAMEFCRRLSQYTGRKYRLPSEAEWEYACRARTTTPFHYGETITSELANYDASYTYAEEAKGEYREETTDVGRFPANGFGLYDMHGNVWEWCGDPSHGNYKGAPTDGSVWSIKFHPFKLSILRGGSWVSYPWFCRSAHRDNNLTRDAIKTNVGFRVARGVG